MAHCSEHSHSSAHCLDGRHGYCKDVGCVCVCHMMWAQELDTHPQPTRTLDDVFLALARIEGLLNHLTTLTTKGNSLMSQLDTDLAALQLAVTNDTAVEQSAITLLNGIPALIKAAVATALAAGATSQQLTAITNLSAVLGANATALAAAVTANTPPTGAGVPTLTSATTASGVVGTPFSFQLAATNAPTSFAAAGLPPGLTIDTTTGVIAGTPTAVGTTQVALTATNATGAGTGTLDITVTAVVAP